MGDNPVLVRIQSPAFSGNAAKHTKHIVSRKSFFLPCQCRQVRAIYTKRKTVDSAVHSVCYAIQASIWKSPSKLSLRSIKVKSTRPSFWVCGMTPHVERNISCRQTRMPKNRGPYRQAVALPTFEQAATDHRDLE